jgi:hypothetical protein
MSDYIKGGVIGLLVGMILAGVGVWWAKDQQVKAVRVELQAAKDANATNVTTIAELKKEAENLNKSCTARVNIKDQTIKRLKQIDSLKGTVKHEEIGNKNIVAGGSGDDILDELNGMWGEGTGQDGVRQADDPGPPAAAGLLPGKVAEEMSEGLYCLDAENAKNLLRNKALQDDREKSLEQSIEGLR